MATPSLRLLSGARLRQELFSRLYVLGLGYVISQATAYRLFETMLRLHNYRRAAAILAIAARRYPGGGDVESMRSTLAIRDGDLARGLPLLAARLAQGDRRAVERLLFRTGSRPRDPRQCSQVLGTIAASSQVDLTHRCYALIAQAYLALRSGDRSLGAELRPRLQELIGHLARHPQAAGCPERNRSNVTKLLISLYTASYHLCLQEADFAACTPIWQEVLALAERIDYRLLNADAGLRMTSNLCRCLALGALVDPRAVPDALPRSLAALDAVEESVQTHCLAPDARGTRLPQENHLEVMQALQEACRDLDAAESTRRTRARRRYARLTNHASNPALGEVILERLAQRDPPAPPASGAPGPEAR